MVMSEEEYRNHPDIINLPEREKIYHYLIYVGYYEDYNIALDILTKNLRNPEELIQAAAIEAVGLLVERFYNIKEDLILPVLFENLKSTSKEILGKTLETLHDIAYCVTRLRRKVFLAYFKNGFDFFKL